MSPRSLSLALSLALGLPLAAHADSIASSASSAGSASLGSLSDSLQGSSNSSRGNNRVAEGDYRVIEVAVAAGRPGLVRIKMQAQQGQDELVLDVPDKALAQRGLGAGDVVSARLRPYGVEFAHADTRQAFFLALDDEWKRELDSHPVL